MTDEEKLELLDGRERLAWLYARKIMLDKSPNLEHVDTHLEAIERCQRIRKGLLQSKVAWSVTTPTITYSDDGNAQYPG